MLSYVNIGKIKKKIIYTGHEMFNISRITKLALYCILSILPIQREWDIQTRLLKYNVIKIDSSMSP